MRRLSAICTSAAASLAAVTALALPASAQAATGLTGVRSHSETAAPRYCFTLVAKVNPPTAKSRVVSQTCSSTHAPGSLLPAGVAVPRQAALLVTFFQNEDYGGLWDTVGGRNGPCDTAGYGLSNLTLANFNVNGISSYTLHSKCKFASYWTGVNYTGHKRSGRKGNAPFVGAIWNDDLHSMRTWA